MSTDSIRISRDFFESEDYLLDRFSRREAFFDLCYLAASEDRSFKIRGVLVEQKKGQVAKSLRDLAFRWRWAVNTVVKYINELKEDGIIDTQQTSVIQLITIKKYLLVDTQTDTQTDTQNENQSAYYINIINNKDKEIKRLKEELSKESPKKKEKDVAEEQMLPLDIDDDKYTFDKVWDLYDKKVGNKEALRKKWAGIKPKDKIKIFEFIPAYVALTEKAYRKNFQTFLNQKAWTNEDIETNGITVPYGSFNPKLVEDKELFHNFAENYNKKIHGSGLKEIDLSKGLTEKRRILFNIAYCLHFNQMKKVVENAIKNPRLNGSTGFAADFDYIFKPDNFLRIFEGY